MFFFKITPFEKYYYKIFIITIQYFYIFKVHISNCITIKYELSTLQKFNERQYNVLTFLKKLSKKLYFCNFKKIK